MQKSIIWPTPPSSKRRLNPTCAPGLPHNSASYFSVAKGRVAKHEFDAVSEDRKIVCAIKTASWKTSGGKRGAGKIQGAYAEIYFLNLVDAEEKYLVLTDPEFFENLRRDSEGKLAPKIELLYCELLDNLKREVDNIRNSSRRELGF